MIWIVIISILVGILIGVVLGSYLGWSGALEMFLVIFRLPVLVARSPGKIKSVWKQWHEERARAVTQRLVRKEEIERLQRHVVDKKKEIRKLKRDIRRVRWQIKEPKEGQTSNK